MQKSSFKIATKFEKKNQLGDLQPIEYQEVEGYAIGNWGVTNWGESSICFVYHIPKGLKLSSLFFPWIDALKILELTVGIFGEDNNGDHSITNIKLLLQWEFEAAKLAARECLYFDDDDELG